MSTSAVAAGQALTPTQALADYYTSELQNGNTLAQSLLAGTPPEFQALYAANSAGENSAISGLSTGGSSSPSAAQQYQTGLLNNATLLAQSLGLGNHVDSFT